MLTFVISHHSELLSCLIGACLQLYYGRKVRIFVVSVLDKTRVQRGTSPWCGVSTVSSLRGNHWDFLNSHIVRGVLMKCLIPLNNIRLAEVPYVENFNPDFPLANQQSVVVARISANEAYAGLLYHPEYLIETLKRFFAHSSNISFTSVGSESTVPSMVRNLPGKVFWINLTGGRTTSGFSLTGRGFSNNDMVIQSKVCSFEPMLPSFGKHSAGVSGIPRTVLWIPFLKTSFAPGIEPRLRCQTSTSGNITSIDISSGVDSALADEVNQRYDLLYCLRVCGYVLDCVGEISHIMSRL